MRGAGIHINRIQALAGRHEEAVAPGAPEADVGAVFREADHADLLACRGDDQHAGASTAPEVAVHIAAHAIRAGGCAGAGYGQFDEGLAIAEGGSVDIPNPHFATGTGVGYVEFLVVGREADSVRTAHAVGDFGDATGFFHAVDGFGHFLVGLEALVVAVDAVGRIGEPDGAVGVDNDVVGGIEALPFELLGDNGDGAVGLVTDDAASAMFTGKLATFVVEGVAVAVARGVAEGGDAGVFFNPAHLDVIWDVAPDQVATDTVPGRAFCPKGAGVVLADDGVADHVLPKGGSEGDDVGVGVLHGDLPGPVAGGGDWRDD